MSEHPTHEGGSDDFAEAQAIKRAMYDGVAQGFVEIIGERDGEPVFALTPKGARFVESGFKDEADA